MIWVAVWLIMILSNDIKICGYHTYIRDQFFKYLVLHTGQRNTELSVINWNRSIPTELTNTNAADELTPCIARPSAMMLNLQDT